MENLDPSESDKFSRLAKEWWNPNGPMKTLHRMNPLRLQYIKQHTALLEKKVLDVGCGGGLLSEALAHEGADVTAIDANHDLIRVAQEHAVHQDHPIQYLSTTIESFHAEHKKFDMIACMELLEHVPDPISVVRTCAQLMSPDALVFFSTLNRNLKSFFFSIVGAEYLLQLLPMGTHEYKKFIRPSELCEWARPYNLRLLHITGIKYQPFRQQCHFTQDVSVNYIACFIKGGSM